MNHMVPAIVLPMVRNHIVLKSLKLPPSSQKVIGYSLKLAPTNSNRKAVLKNCTMNVTVVVLDRRSVSVGNPIQSMSMIQTVRKIKLIPVSTYDSPVTRKKLKRV